MSGTKHTPGPWSLVISHKSWHMPFQVDDADGLCIVALDIHPVRNNEANARLIASAPDLLDALEMIVVAWEFGGVDEVDIKEARAAIAKAVGHD